MNQYSERKIMKNKGIWIAGLLAAMLLLAVLSVNKAYAADSGTGTDGSTVNLSLWSYTLSGNSYTLDRYTGSIANGKITGSVPAYINGKPVTQMTGTFSGCTALIQAPAIPGSVTRMRNAFDGCTGLTQAPEIPNSVTDLNSAFRGCTGLVRAPALSDNVTNLGGTFYECKSLTYVPRLPGRIASLYYTFYGCTALMQVLSIPDGVTSLEGAFYGCTGLAEAPEIPAGTENMASAFRGCTALVQAPVIPDSVTNLNAAFRDCTSLIHAPVISDNVNNLGGTFYGCTSLTYVPRLPKNVIGLYYTFCYCSSLTEAPEIPDGVTSLDSTFVGCTGMTQAPEIPDSVIDMNQTFYGCTGLASVPKLPNYITILKYTFYNCTSLKKAPVIPDSVTSLDAAFYGCKELKEASVIPDGMVSMRYAFGCCSGLIQAPKIPDSVTNMENTFRGCTGLTAAPRIPANVTNLDGTFSCCTSLTGDIYIPKAVKSLNNIFVCTVQPITMIYSDGNTAAEAYAAPANVTKAADSSVPEIISVTETDTLNIKINARDDGIIAGYTLTASEIAPEKGWQMSNTFSDLSDGIYYAWAIDGVGNISACKKVTVFNKSAVPEIEALPAGTYISFSWSPADYCSSYEIELDGKPVKTGLKTTYIYKGLKPDTQHTYRIRAVCVLGASNWSPLQKVFTTDGIITAQPQSITSKASNNTITLTWDTVDDAEGYDIAQVLPDGSMGAAIDNGSVTTCEMRGLLPDTSYTYGIRARNSAGEGPWSTNIQVLTYLLDTPQNVVLQKSDTSIIFSWEEAANADTYQLKYYETASAGETTGPAINAPLTEGMAVTVNVTGTSIEITGLKPCTEYKYSLRAVNSQGSSSWREEKSTFTLPQKPGIPQNVNAAVSESKITVSWTGLPDTAVAGYDIELDGVILENDTEDTYIHEGLEPYSVHTYRVRARNELTEGDWSQLNSIRTLPARPSVPEGITVKSTQTGAVLSWKAEPGADGYDIYVFRLDDDDKEILIEQINNIEECTYTHRRLTKGEEYRYRLRTRNIQGISDWSGDIINNAIKAQCKKGNTIDLGLTAADVVDFSSYEMVVTYNPGVVEVVDLSTITGKPELTAGKIEGTDINVKEASDGRIVFTVERAATPGEAWTGVINGIKFKAKQTGGTTVTYTVFTMPQQ